MCDEVTAAVTGNNSKKKRKKHNSFVKESSCYFIGQGTLPIWAWKALLPSLPARKEKPKVDPNSKVMRVRYDAFLAKGGSSGMNFFFP